MLDNILIPGTGKLFTLVFLSYSLPCFHHLSFTTRPRETSETLKDLESPDVVGLWNVEDCAIAEKHSYLKVRWFLVLPHWPWMC